MLIYAKIMINQGSDVMKIYLIRHGEVNNPKRINYGCQPGWHLSQTGENQITAVGQKIKDKGFKICRIVASPLKRAQQTASILSRALQTPVTTDERLIEWDTGKWTGRTMQDFYENSGYYSPDLVIDGMEPLNDLASRVISAIQDAASSRNEGDIIICSHREPMASAIVKLQNLPWHEIHNIDMPMGSVWELVFKDCEFKSAKRFL